MNLLHVATTKYRGKTNSRPEGFCSDSVRGRAGIQASVSLRVLLIFHTRLLALAHSLCETRQQWTQLVEHCYQINISHNKRAAVVVGSDTPYGLLNQDYSDEKTAFKLLKEARIISWSG